MRLMLVTDAWHPQVNGVVRALSTTVERLTERGHEVEVLAPERFRNVPCPTYPEIRLALCTPRRVGRLIEQARPEAVHIATEGPLGLAARAWLKRRGLPFTTSFHTLFPAYLNFRFGVPERFVEPRLLVSNQGSPSEQISSHGRRRYVQCNLQSALCMIYTI